MQTVCQAAQIPGGSIVSDLIFGLAILDLILSIVAAVRTSSGEAYRYPLTIRVIK